ncbi:phosphonate metabolism transcriptional regulator PhnF [Agrobacterium rubi]|uniref:Phosphonate metabolism transcriptional regulator PhnF n=2 Tax=Agrobacterium rubi TaxID=28099 RepID=A0AAE7RED5_9HYPH|nr:phosphonate metabolism transcriptional regulator PhnF [Agrobacterium rubi]MBP1878838.1 GntR family phosphonate transport system transcriptional regulator [Agrobacterium rubi]MCL6652805.1 phosphonate metabolism transcriptional regulator PhnF [Agrobacterium rubi]NTE88543.1 phosphonate metabolism transcriptional regulator PhnF [Agrobacterium rubi]NTF04371.1 phosphonate metabolism transcriptional regulator PhnF [Agrobacterium rubi]NTF09904.1 phosphonate metabolism transcriptional regulator PhnF
MDDLDDGVSRWRRVADGIRGAIAEGTINDQLPTEVALASHYGVNRHTVRRAIAVLSAEGLLRAERGRGTFVNAVPKRIFYPIGARARFSENMMRQSLEPSGRLIHAELIAANAAQARLLDCKPGAPLHRMEHLAVADGVPLSRSTSLFSSERFPGIIAAYAETGSITKALEMEGLSDYRRKETRLTAERASARDISFLTCAPDSIVLVSQAIDIDPHDAPVQSIITRFLADRMELVFSNAS